MLVERGTERSTRAKTEINDKTEKHREAWYKRGVRHNGLRGEEMIRQGKNKRWKQNEEKMRETERDSKDRRGQGC